MEEERGGGEILEEIQDGDVVGYIRDFVENTTNKISRNKETVKSNISPF